MKKILFLDIDGTLFDSTTFRTDFYKKIAEEFNLSEIDINEMNDIYQGLKHKISYFDPEVFLKEISNRFPSINYHSLKEALWSLDLVDKNIYKDASVINDLTGIDLAIFSGGVKDFQKQKVRFINNLPEENIFIFPGKLGKLAEVLENYSDYEPILVDNELKVLNNEIESNSKLTAILIDRAGNQQVSGGIKKIRTLDELKGLI